MELYLDDGPLYITINGNISGISWCPPATERVETRVMRNGSTLFRGWSNTFKEACQLHDQMQSLFVKREALQIDDTVDAIKTALQSGILEHDLDNTLIISSKAYDVWDSHISSFSPKYKELSV